MNCWRTALQRSGILAALTLAGCGPAPMPITTTPVHALGGVTMVTPRCVEVRSCLLGQVVAAETSTPLARAAVFLQREPQGAAGDGALQIVRTTDEQGVFTVADAPAGRYSVSVYKGARRISASGLELGGPGTLMVPIRLPPPS
ncbi:MAG: carboxypeptidase-like regulatory domain-containing protein [Nannocystaceae bacterium]|nr:carboxypeptidase-like regulatory domain-containing protein [Nannocystaceae bacterium]